MRSPACIGCGRVVDGCLGLAERCRYRLLLRAAHRLLVSGEDKTKSLRNRQRHRWLARQQMRELLAAADPNGLEATARETWPAWARAVDEAVSETRSAA